MQEFFYCEPNVENKFPSHGQRDFVRQDDYQCLAPADENNSSILHKFVDGVLPFDPIYKTILEESIKSAPLFISGGKGIVLTLVTHALAEVKPDSTTDRQCLDAIAGLGKGALMRGGFDAFGRLSPALKLLPTHYDLALRGTSLGIISRFADTACSLDTWLDKTTGQTDFAKGTLLTGASVFSPVAIGCDIASFGLAKGMHIVINATTRGLVDRSPFLSMVVMGSTFGLNGGAIGEYVSELKEQKPIDWHKISNATLIGGASGALASMPGAYQMHLKANSILKSMDFSELSQRPSFTPDKTSAKNSAPSIHKLPLASSIPLRMTPRFADIIEPQDIHELELPKRSSGTSIRELNRRLKYDSCVSKEIPVWKSHCPSDIVPGPGKGSVKLESIFFRQYFVEGHKSELLVPNSYCKELYSVREGNIRKHDFWKDRYKGIGKELENKVVQDLGGEPNFNVTDYRLLRFRALPEDVILNLDKLPNSNLVKSISLLGEANPYDFLKSTEPTTRASADGESGDIRLHALDYGDRFARTMNHEWGHLLAHKYPNWFKTYEETAKLEDALNENAANPRPYGLKNTSENWSVMGEALLHPKAKTFIEWLNKAPKRSSAYSLALGESLVEDPAETSIPRQQFQNRVDFVKQELLPRMRKELLQELKTSDPSDDAICHKLSLLEDIAQPVNLKLLKDLAKRTQSESVARQIVKTGLNTFQNEPEKQIDFLFSLEGGAPIDAALRTAMYDLPIERVTQNFLPRLQTLEAKFGSNDRRFKRLFDSFDARILSEIVKGDHFPPLELTLYWLNHVEPSLIGVKHRITPWELTQILSRIADMNETLSNHEKLREYVSSRQP